MKRPIESTLHLNESVPNTDRHFGSADRYYPLWVEDAGRWQPALLTTGQLHEAILRAKGNPEDVPPRRRSLLDRLLGR